MNTEKASIYAQLQREILPLQGYKPCWDRIAVDPGLGAINDAFPNGSFPMGAVHEFFSATQGDAAATAGFVSGILGAMMKNAGPCLWISTARTLFPPALKAFGIEPDRVIFVDLHKEKDALWAVEEALKCRGVASVIGEIPDLSFTASRRLQLAVEQSRVTGFFLRHQPR
jgi:protein ImuA